VITEVLVPAGGSYRWEIRTPLSEIWGAVVAPATDWVAKIPRRALILDVELVGTPYRNSAVVELPGSGGILGLDENGNGLPDLWEQQFDQTQTDPGQAPTGDNADPNADPDGDGWRNLAEFLQGTDPLDPQSLPPGRVFRFQLWTGWNLISLPIILEDSTCAGVFGANIQAPVWTFRPEGGYAEVERLEPHTAYWVFAERATELAVAGQPHAAGRCRMGGGWNLVGAGGPASLPATVREQASVWQWSAAEQCYVADPDPVLQEGRGYWIAMPETMGAPVEVEILTNE
jgi:hypothetical protein